jgi:thiamine-monophosphate kinase
LDELSRLELLRALFSATALPAGVSLGIGDDAAVLARSDAPLVWTVDTAVEGVHFRRDWLSLEDIGWRSLAAAASDLAAMGASPRGALSALILPAQFGDADLLALARGQAEAAAALETAVIGGNLARGSELSITTTLLGEARQPILRGGARAGHVVGLAGAIGVAAAGLALLQQGTGNGAPGDLTERVLQAFRRPHARIAEGLAAAGHAHAGIDVSDGLALDAWRLARASGVAVVLDADALLRVAGPDLIRVAALLGRDPLELALYGGDDYALLMTFAAHDVPAPFVAVGTCGAGVGIWLRSPDGTTRPLEAKGFDHFAR